jgi:hypothetical protein
MPTVLVVDVSLSLSQLISLNHSITRKDAVISGETFLFSSENSQGME